MKLLTWPQSRQGRVPQFEEREHDVDGWITSVPAAHRPMPERVTVIKPCDLEPQDWSVMGSRVPGVEGHPYTLREAHKVARAFGGKVVPLAYALANRKRSESVFPHPGRMVPSGGKR